MPKLSNLKIHTLPSFHYSKVLTAFVKTTAVKASSVLFVTSTSNLKLQTLFPLPIIPTFQHSIPVRQSLCQKKSPVKPELLI
jgi:hypothetical protein